MVSAFASRNLYNKLMYYQLSKACCRPELREARCSFVPGSAISPWQPSYMGTTSSGAELIAVRLLFCTRTTSKLI